MSTRTTLTIVIAVVIAGAGFLAYAPRSGAPAPERTDISAPAEATATFVVAGAPFTVAVSPDGRVLDAMRALASEGALAFTVREYPGLGAFVESINGQKSAGGMNWMLYVNGVSASSGASLEPVRAGDVFEWKYEKSY